MSPEILAAAVEVMTDAEQFLRHWNDAPHITAKLREIIAKMQPEPAPRPDDKF